MPWALRPSWPINNQPCSLRDRWVRGWARHHGAHLVIVTSTRSWSSFVRAGPSASEAASTSLAAVVIAAEGSCFASSSLSSKAHPRVSHATVLASCLVYAHSRRMSVLVSFASVARDWGSSDLCSYRCSAHPHIFALNIWGDVEPTLVCHLQIEFFPVQINNRSQFRGGGLCSCSQLCFPVQQALNLVPFLGMLIQARLRPEWCISPRILLFSVQRSIGI